jgi:hypothetical protein
MICTLDPFSMLYFFGVLASAAVAFVTFLGFISALRRIRQALTIDSGKLVARLNNRYLLLASIQSFAIVLTSGCVANQVFAVWFSYMARATDANPFFALHSAWVMFQLLVFFHVIVDASRRFAWFALGRIQSAQPV